MKTFTIFSSEKVIYRTEIQAKSYDDAMNIFYNKNVCRGDLTADSYECFGVDNVEESKTKVSHEYNY
jgi:hypothetical protein